MVRPDNDKSYVEKVSFCVGIVFEENTWIKLEISIQDFHSPGKFIHDKHFGGHLLSFIGWAGPPVVYPKSSKPFFKGSKQTKVKSAPEVIRLRLWIRYINSFVYLFFGVHLGFTGKIWIHSHCTKKLFKNQSRGHKSDPWAYWESPSRSFFLVHRRAKALRWADKPPQLDKETDSCVLLDQQKPFRVYFRAFRGWHDLNTRV